MVQVLQRLEAVPEAFPAVPDGLSTAAAALNSDAIWQRIEGYLAHRWGATDSLASNHPYKDLPPIFDNSPKLSPQPYVYPVGSVVSTWSPTAKPRPPTSTTR